MCPDVAEVSTILCPHVPLLFVVDEQPQGVKPISPPEVSDPAQQGDDLNWVYVAKLPVALPAVFWQVPPPVLPPVGLPPPLPFGLHVLLGVSPPLSTNSPQVQAGTTPGQALAETCGVVQPVSAALSHVNILLLMTLWR